MAPTSPSPKFPIKILIIEDSPPCAAALQITLEALGISDITIAPTGKIAIQEFSKPFDLILTDLHLPDMNGIDLTYHYRQVFPKKDTPIICYSSDYQNYYKESIEAGINDFLEKPATTEALKEILECWLVRKIPLS